MATRNESRRCSLGPTVAQQDAAVARLRERRKCKYCDGDGKVLILNSWFVADGYRRERCDICAGTGINPAGFTAPPEHVAFMKRAKARIRQWGGLKPE